MRPPLIPARCTCTPAVACLGFPADHSEKGARLGQARFFWLADVSLETSNSPHQVTEMRSLFFDSQPPKLCREGLISRALSRLRAPQNSDSNSCMNWNMLPISSQPGVPSLRYSSGVFGL